MLSYWRGIMAFERPSISAPAAVQSLSIRVRVWPQLGSWRAVVRVALQDSGGNEIPELSFQADLAPHITSQQLSQLESFMNILVEKAENELL